jgi:hypothetical protein
MAATTAAVIGATSAAAGSYMSFKQASQQSKAATTARIEAEKAIQEAKKRAEQNVYEALSLTKEPYERAREAALVSGAQAIEAGRESERGGAATAGRALMAQNIQQGQIADVQAQEMQNLNQMVAAEEGRLKDYAANVSLAEAAGAQEAIKDAEKLRAQAMTQGFQGLGQFASSVGQALPLYYEGQGAKAYDNLVQQATTAGLSQEQLQNQVAALGVSDPNFAKLSGVGYSAKSVDAKGNPIVNAMTPLQFQDFMIQNPDITKQLIKNNMFAPKYTPYVERPTGADSVLIKPQAPPVSKTAGSYRPGDLGMLPPELLKAYGIDPFSIQ